MSPLSQLHFSGSLQLHFPFSPPQLCGKFGCNKLSQGQFPQNVPHKPWLPEKHPDVLSEVFWSIILHQSSNRCWKTHYSPFQRMNTAPFATIWSLNQWLPLIPCKPFCDLSWPSSWPKQFQLVLWLFYSTQKRRDASCCQRRQEKRNTGDFFSGFMRFFEGFSWGNSQGV